MSLWKKWPLLLLLLVAPLFLSGCDLPWQKNIAGLQVQITEGVSAQIFLNDLHLGATPIDKDDLRPGVYKLKIVPDTATEKQTYETEIHLYPGALTSVLWSFSGPEPSGTGDILELEPLSSQDRAELAVITVPEGASVALNSVTYGLSPVILDSIDPGEYSLTVNAVGHVRKTFSTKASKGYRLHVFSRLEKESDTTAAVTPVAVEATPTPSPSATPLILGTPTQPTPRPSPVPTPSPTPPITTPVATPAAMVAKPYVTITDTGTGWLRVRDQASSAGQEVAKVTVGANYKYLSTLNGWYEIEYALGQSGWISGQYARVVK